MITDFWHILPSFQISADADRSRVVEPYSMRGTTAVIPLVGPTSKYGGFDTTSTMAIRRQVRMAAEDDTVESVLLYVDSPGGQVAGNRDLARDVSHLASLKPTHAYAADMMASAAYGVGSQASRIVANESALIGSIGTMSALYDTTKLAERMGVKVHQITSGGVKGVGQFGTPITQEHIEYQQQLINRISEQFIHSVAQGRNMSVGRIRELADGRVHLAADAAKLGLVDDVATLETAIDALQSVSSSNQKVFSMHYNTSESGNPAGLATPMAQPALIPVSQSAGFDTPAPVAAAPQPEPAPAPAPAPAPEASKAASIQEIEAACPNAPAEFILAQVKASATLQSVQTAYIAMLVEQNAALQAQPAPAPAPVAEEPSAPPAPAPAASVPGNQPVLPEPEEDTAWDTDVDAFFASELEKEKHFLKEGNPGLDSHQAHSRAVMNVYARYPDLREARLAKFNPTPVRAPKAPSA